MLKILLTTFIVMMGLLVVTDSHAQLSARDGSYVNKSGVFKNPNFVEGKTGWTISGGCTQAYDATIPFAERAIKFTCVAATFSIKQCTTVFAGFENAYIEYYSSIKVNATSTPVTWNILENGTDNLYAKEILQDDKFHALSYPSFAPSGNDCIEVKSEPLFTGTITLTQVNITQKLTSVRSINDVDTDWVSYNPTITMFGTVSDVNLEYKRQGEDLLIRGSFTSGHPDAVEARVPLPTISGFQLESKSTLKLVEHAGTVSISNSADAGLYVLSEPSKEYMTFGMQNSARAGLTKALATIIGTNNRKISINARIPIEGWQTGRVDAIGQRQELTAKTANTFGAYVASNGVVTADSYDFINGNCVVSDTSLYTCSLNDLDISARLNCSIGLAGTTADRTIRYDVTGATSSTISFRGLAGGSTTKIPNAFFIVCTKSDADLNKSIDVIGKFKMSQIKQDVEQFPLTEQKLCDACYEGKAHYKRCFKTISLSGTQATFEAGLSITSAIGYEAGVPLIFASNLSGLSNRSMISYTSATGVVAFTQNNADGQTPVGSPICATYTKD